MDFADTAVAILAAGQGKRFGSDKLMADLDGVPVGLHAAQTFQPMKFGWRFAVCRNVDHPTRHSRERGNPAFSATAESGIPAFAGMTGKEAAIAGCYSAIGFEIVANKKPQLGQSHSLHLAVRAAERTEAKALLILLADMPFVSAKHIAAIAAQNTLTASTDGTRAMPPALFPRSTWPDLLQTTGDAGARALLAKAHLVSAPPHELRDIDLPADLREMHA